MLNSPSTPPERSSTREAVTVDGGSIFSAAPPTEPDGFIPNDRTTDSEAWAQADLLIAMVDSGKARIEPAEPDDGIGVAWIRVMDAAAIAADRLAAVGRERDELRAVNERLVRVSRELTEGLKRECYAKFDTEVENDELREQEGYYLGRIEELRQVAVGAGTRAEAAEASLEAVKALSGELWDLAEEFLYDGDSDRPLNAGYDKAFDLADRLAVLSVAPRPQSAKRTACRGFAWVGQSFAHCDECGLPFWEHTHSRDFDRSKGPFALDGEVLVPITAEQADACRRKWGPVSDAAPEATP